MNVFESVTALKTIFFQFAADMKMRWWIRALGISIVIVAKHPSATV